MTADGLSHRLDDALQFALAVGRCIPKPDGDRRGEEGLVDGCVQLKPEVSERVRVSSFWRKVVRPLSNRHGHHCDVCPSPIEVVGDDGSQEFE